MPEHSFDQSQLQNSQVTLCREAGGNTGQDIPNRELECNHPLYFGDWGVTICGDLKCVKPIDFEIDQCLTGLLTSTEVAKHSFVQEKKPTEISYFSF